MDIFLMRRATAARLYVVEGFETAPAFWQIFGCSLNIVERFDVSGEKCQYE
jgi:hypothetical protein